ncbi:MAG: class I SAM-dependent methyltransferase [Ignavibacteria bacterium]
MAENSIQFTADIAEIYEKYLAPVFFISTSKDLVTHIPGSPAKILELAAGTGQVTRILVERYPDAKIFATDLNPGMLDVAKRIVTSENITWDIVNAEEIPYSSDEFDALICQFGIMFFPDKPKALGEAYRVLKPGGTITFNTWDKLENNHICKLADDAVKSVFPVDPPQFYHIPFSMYDTVEMAKMMESAGFKNVKVENRKMEGFSDSAENAVLAFTQGNPMALQIKERDESKLPEVKAAMLDNFKEHFGNGHFKIPLSEFIVTAIK